PFPGKGLMPMPALGGAADPRHLAWSRRAPRQAERLGASMAATQALVSGRSKAMSAYRHRLGERRQVHHLLVPGGELGMARPPRLGGVAEVEIAQRAADGDLADRVEVAERGRLLLEFDDGARHLALLERNVGLAALVLRQGELAPAGLRRIEDAVG